MAFNQIFWLKVNRWSRVSSIKLIIQWNLTLSALAIRARLLFPCCLGVKMFSPQWLRHDWVFFCFITKKNVCCHGDRESRELIQYFITDWTKRKMKHNLPFWKAGRQGLKVFTLLCHLPVIAGTVIMCCKNHYNLSQFSCNCLLSTCQQFSEMMSRLCAGAINCNIHSCHLYPIKMLEGTVSRV